MSLLQMQRDFCGFVLARRGDAAGAAIAAAIARDPAPGLRVYRNAYRLRLGEALEDVYEKTRQRLGDEAFFAAAAQYIETHCSMSWTLSDYGGRFPAMLKNLYPADPVAGELAALEWAMRRVFDGPDGEAVDSEALGGVDWESAVLHFVPTLQLLPVVTNCGAIWAAMAAADLPPAVAILSTPSALAVWRKGLAPHFRTIEAREHLAIRTARAGAPFGALCALMRGAGADNEETAAEVGGMLGRWLQDGMLAAISAGPGE